MKTNILVQYSGGGYGGCIWEWNFFYIDEFGVFNDIYSSGCDGIDNLPDAEELIIDDESTTFVYDMSNEDDIKGFSTENHARSVYGVLQWFEHYNSSCVKFFAVCSVCKNPVNSDDIVLENETLRCCECHSIGTCRCCNEYVGNDNIVEVNPDEHDDHSYICTECKEDHDNERETEDLEDLRWQSFCTGKPDMFSDVLRPMWVS